MELLCLPSKQLESGKGGKRAAAKTHIKKPPEAIYKEGDKENRENFERLDVQVGLGHA